MADGSETSAGATLVWVVLVFVVVGGLLVLAQFRADPLNRRDGGGDGEPAPTTVVP
jgi:hypothetical protein